VVGGFWSPIAQAVWAHDRAQGGLRFCFKGRFPFWAEKRLPIDREGRTKPASLPAIFLSRPPARDASKPWVTGDGSAGKPVFVPGAPFSSRVNRRPGRQPWFRGKPWLRIPPPSVVEYDFSEGSVVGPSVVETRGTRTSPITTTPFPGRLRPAWMGRAAIFFFVSQAGLLATARPGACHAATPTECRPGTQSQDDSFVDTGQLSGIPGNGTIGLHIAAGRCKVSHDPLWLHFAAAAEG